MAELEHSAWSALGGSILVAIYNGGVAGVLYELWVACCEIIRDV
jgi:hypothetical protein